MSFDRPLFNKDLEYGEDKENFVIKTRHEYMFRRDKNIANRKFWDLIDLNGVTYEHKFEGFAMFSGRAYLEYCTDRDEPSGLSHSLATWFLYSFPDLNIYDPDEVKKILAQLRAITKPTLVHVAFTTYRMDMIALKNWMDKNMKLSKVGGQGKLTKGIVVPLATLLRLPFVKQEPFIRVPYEYLVEPQKKGNINGLDKS